MERGAGHSLWGRRHSQGDEIRHELLCSFVGDENAGCGAASSRGQGDKKTDSDSDPGAACGPLGARHDRHRIHRKREDTRFFLAHGADFAAGTLLP